MNDKYHEKYLQEVYSNCATNDPSKATESVIKWARYYFKEPLLSGLAEIEALTQSADLIKALHELEASKYSFESQPWNGKELKQALQVYLKTHNEPKKQTGSFAELNP